MNEANELITWLGVKIKADSEENAKKFQKGLDTIKSSVNKVNTFFFGAGGAMNYFKEQIMGGSQELVNLSEKTGVSIEKLQQWKYAANASGQSFQGMIGDLENFRKIGIDAISLSGKLSSVGTRTALQMKDRYGLSDDMFNLLRQGPEKVRSLINQAPVIPAEKVQTAAKTDQQMKETLAQIDEMTREIMTELAPLALEVLKFVNEFIKENRDLIKSSLKPVLYGLTALFAGGKIAKFIEGSYEAAVSAKAIGKSVNTLLKKIPGVAKIEGLIGRVITTLGPLTLIAATISSIYGILKDFFNKGAENTVDEIDKDIETGEAKWYDLINPAKGIAREFGHAGRDIANIFSTPAEESFNKVQEAIKRRELEKNQKTDQIKIINVEKSEPAEQPKEEKEVKFQGLKNLGEKLNSLPSLLKGNKNNTSEEVTLIKIPDLKMPELKLSEKMIKVMAELPELKLPAGRINQRPSVIGGDTNNSTVTQNSGNTYIVNVANEQQATNIMTGTGHPFQFRPAIPGGFGQNV